MFARKQCQQQQPGGATWPRLQSPRPLLQNARSSSGRPLPQAPQAQKSLGAALLKTLGGKLPQTCKSLGAAPLCSLGGKTPPLDFLSRFYPGAAGGVNTVKRAARSTIRVIGGGRKILGGNGKNAAGTAATLPL